MKLQDNPNSDHLLIGLWILAIVYGGLVVYAATVEDPFVEFIAGVTLTLLLALLIGVIVYMNRLTTRSNQASVAIFTIAIILQLYLFLAESPQFGMSVPNTLALFGVFIFVLGRSS